MKISLPQLHEMKLAGAPIVMVTAYDHPSGRIVEQAGCLFLALSEAAELTRSGERDAGILRAAMAREIGATPLARLEYAIVVDEATFAEVHQVEAPARALVAARFGGTRLIDNLRLSPGEPVGHAEPAPGPGREA